MKLNGRLGEILRQKGSVDLVELLQDELQLPPSKAEALAQRIDKKYLQALVEPKTAVSRILQTSVEGNSPNKGVYALDCLSAGEFPQFMRWLLEESGYDVKEENKTTCGVDFLAVKDGEAIAVAVKKYPLDALVSEAALTFSEKTKQAYGCSKAVVATATYFSDLAKLEAEKIGVELWDTDTIADMINAVRRKVEVEAPPSFPAYSGSLLQSLLRLEECRDFIIERRPAGRFELFLAGVKYPLLTFQAEGDAVARCVFRMKNYEPVGENETQALIWTNEVHIRTGPDEGEAYAAVIRYLKDFIE